MERTTDGVGDFLGGFVAAEGCCRWSAVRGSTPKQTFTFVVALGATDRGVCERFRSFLGVGHVLQYPRRQPHYDDEARFQVRKLEDLVQVVVPFLDDHLPASYKRQQYEVWRAALLAYWEHDAKRVRPCTIEVCESPRRAKGLCRRHYHQATGR